MNKILFLNVDNAVTTTISGKPFKQHSKDVAVLPGTTAALDYFKSAGWLILGISNQTGVEASYESLAEVKAEMQFTIELLPQIASIYLCPDFHGFHCWRIEYENYIPSLFDSPYKGYYRKPSPGILFYAYNFENCCDNPEDFMKDCCMVGNNAEDKETARNAGCSFLDAESFRNKSLL